MKLVNCWPSKIKFDQFNSILWLNAFSRKALLHTRLVYFMAVLHSRGDLSEEVPGLLLWQSLFVLNVVIQLSSARVLHHHHHPLSALKHWRHNTCLMSLDTHTHTDAVRLLMWFTLIQTDDMWVHKRGADLHFSLDVSSVQIIPQSLLSDGFNSHLKHKQTHHWTKYMHLPVSIRANDEWMSDPLCENQANV